MTIFIELRGNKVIGCRPVVWIWQTMKYKKGLCKDTQPFENNFFLVYVLRFLSSASPPRLNKPRVQGSGINVMRVLPSEGIQGPPSTESSVNTSKKLSM